MKNLIAFFLFAFVSLTSQSAFTAEFFYKDYVNDDIHLADEAYNSLSRKGIPINLNTLLPGQINGKEVVIMIFGKVSTYHDGPQSSVAYGIIKSSGNKNWVLKISNSRSVVIEKEYIVEAAIVR